MPHVEFMIHRVFSFSTWNPSDLHGFCWEISCSSYWGFLVHNECLPLQLLRSSPSFGSLTVLCCAVLEFILFGVHWAFGVCGWMFVIKCGKLLGISSWNILSAPFSVLLLGLLLYICWYIGWCSTRLKFIELSPFLSFFVPYTKSLDWPVSMFTCSSACTVCFWAPLVISSSTYYSFELQNFYLIPSYNLFLFGTLLLGQTSFSL